MRPDHDLNARLAGFVDAGLIPRVPTPFQVLQGELEMAPWVLSTDVTDESAYRRTLLAHPIVRQPLLLRVIGLDHFAMGAGLGSRLESVVRHLQLTWHSGFPLFDLQIIQTHPDGLATLRASFEALLDDSTPSAQRINRIARRLFVDPTGYQRRFVEAGGWIERAEARAYPTPDAEGSAMPPEFFGLVPFLNYCAVAFPATVGELGGWRLPTHGLRLLGRRFREAGGLGWVTAARRLLTP